MFHRAAAVLAFTVLTPLALPAQTVPVRFSFDAGSATSADAATIIARRQLVRAWQDTVEVLLEQMAAQANLRIVAAGASANFLTETIMLPVQLPTGGVQWIISAVVFEPATLGGWKYLSHFVLWSPGAQDAATGLLRSTVSVINNRRRT